MPKIQYNKQQYSITIPKEIIEQGKFFKGEVLTVGFNERGNLEYRRSK